MSIKSFKDYFEEQAPAADYVPKKDEDETKELKPRVKGEKEFKDMHKVATSKHPVAGDHMFNGSRDEVKK